MIYCTSCKHHVRHRPEGMVWCKNPKNGIDLSDGSAKPQVASLNRKDENFCGEKALWWEEKVETKPTSWSPTSWWEMFWSMKK